MLAGLNDPYTVYMDPEEYASWQEMTSGSYSGVGIVVAFKDHLVTAAAVFEESPAAAAGIQQGDVVHGCGRSVLGGPHPGPGSRRHKGPR